MASETVPIQTAGPYFTLGLMEGDSVLVGCPLADEEHGRLVVDGLAAMQEWEVENGPTTDEQRWAARRG